MGLTQEAILRRMAIGAKVSLEPLSETGIQDIQELLSKYASLLEEHGQSAEALHIQNLLSQPEQHFIQIVPIKQQADPAISTE